MLHQEEQAVTVSLSLSIFFPPPQHQDLGLQQKTLSMLVVSVCLLMRIHVSR